MKKLKTIVGTVASAAGMLALGFGLICLFSLGAILLAFFTMAPPPPAII